MPTSLDSLSHRVGVLLASHDITTIEQLASIHPLILIGIRGFGRKAYAKSRRSSAPAPAARVSRATGRVTASASYASVSRVGWPRIDRSSPSGLFDARGLRPFKGVLWGEAIHLDPPP